MDCSKARAGLWPPERPRLVGDDVAIARKHVSDCPECEAYFAQDRALLDLYDRTRRVPAPLAVRERVFDALARARWDVRRHEGAGATPLPTTPTHPWRATTRAVKLGLLRFGALPTAVAAVMALVVIAEFRPGGGTPAYDSDMFVEDYLRRAVGQDHIVTSDPAEVTRFLERELGIRIEPIQSAGLDLQRAEICLLEGQRGAMIVYKKDGAEVSHYLIPRDDAEAREPALSGRTRLDPSDMPVVTWATPRVEQALVGQVGSERLIEMATRGSS
jgi:hypothetical protein